KSPADIDICYTLPKNFKRRFAGGSSIKAAIYNYETSITPKEWQKDLDVLDLILPSSQFSKKVFLKNGWPEEKMRVIPLGINPDLFMDDRVCRLSTDKKFRFLNISIPHYRKNIGLLVDAYYRAFSEKDDVCLVIKTSFDKPKFKFECDVKKEIIKVQNKYKDRGLPQVEIIVKKFVSLTPLYNACHSLVSATSSEGFGLPLLEGMAANKVVIAPNCTGQSDFMNNDNSIPVKFSEIKAGNKYQYWRPHPSATTFLPDVQSLADNMLFVYNNYKETRNRLIPEMEKTSKIFTWENSAKKIAGLS
ncbi:hypothetical protein CMI47_23025, partial [Candidatus Pacearchaeota archaeon]|nr:hypothetical protein [Candidatus Pacearchaeota archaeon]